MAPHRRPVKGDHPTLHHSDRYGYILLHLLIRSKAIALGDTFHAEGRCPGHETEGGGCPGHETGGHVRLWPMVTWVISYSENGVKTKITKE